MDSSNSATIDFFTGREQRDLATATSRERYEIFRWTILQCRRLEYFPGFEPLSKHLNWWNMTNCRETPTSVQIERPARVTERTRFLYVATVSKESVGNEGFQCDLLLDTSARLYRWRETHRYLSRLPPSGIGTAINVYLIQSLTIEDLDEPAIESVLTGPVLWQVIRNLAVGVDDGVRKREEQLASLKRIQAALTGIHDRCIRSDSEQGTGSSLLQ